MAKDELRDSREPRSEAANQLKSTLEEAIEDGSIAAAFTEALERTREGAMIRLVKKRPELARAAADLRCAVRRNDAEAAAALGLDFGQRLERAWLTELLAPLVEAIEEELVPLCKYERQNAKAVKAMRDANPGTPDDVKEAAVSEFNRLVKQYPDPKQSTLAKRVAAKFGIGVRSLHRWRKPVATL